MLGTSAKIYDRGQALVERLQAEGYSAKKAHNSDLMIVQGNKQDDGTYKFPEVARADRINIFTTEHGASSLGGAQVVCDYLGRTLTPYRTDLRRNTYQGYFSGGLLVAVKFTCKDRKLEIVRHELEIVELGREKTIVQIQSTQLYEGSMAILPPELSKFQSAANAVHEKAACFDCHHLHFANAATPPRK